MSAAWHRLCHAARQQNWALLVLLFSLLGAVASHWLVTRPLQARLQETELAIQAQQPLLARMREARSHPLPSPQLRLTQFYRSFPVQGSAARRLQMIYATADRYQLQLPRGDYKALPLQGGPLQRYEISLPLHGSYRQIRLFLQRVLSADPALLVSEVRLKRDNIGQEQVDAGIRLVLLWREG